MTSIDTKTSIFTAQTIQDVVLLLTYTIYYCNKIKVTKSVGGKNINVSQMLKVE